MDTFISFAYLLCLVFSIGCLTAFDLREGSRLIVRSASRYAIAASMGALLVFDILGVWAGIFATNPRFVSGIHLVTPDLPLEEFLLLFLISYLIVLVSFTKAKWNIFS